MNCTRLVVKKRCLWWVTKIKLMKAFCFYFVLVFVIRKVKRILKWSFSEKRISEECISFINRKLVSFSPLHASSRSIPICIFDLLVTFDINSFPLRAWKWYWATIGQIQYCSQGLTQEFHSLTSNTIKLHYSREVSKLCIMVTCELCMRLQCLGKLEHKLTLLRTLVQ